MSGAMQLDLTDEEAAALINLLTGIIEADQFPTSPRIETLRQIRAKLPGIRMKRHARRGLAKLQHLDRRSRHHRRDPRHDQPRSADPRLPRDADPSRG